MEDTHLTDSNRFKSFIKCIFIAFAIAIKIGDYSNKKSPIKVKKTLKCKAYSILQWGVIAIKNAYSKCLQHFENLLKEILTYLPITVP